MLRAAAYQYQFYEMAHAAMAPARAVSDAAYFLFRNPFNPFSATTFGKNVAAGAELFERLTRRYGKPVFGLTSTTIDGVAHDVLEEIVWSRPFANLLRFVRPTLPGHDGAAQAADRRSDVGPLRNLAAWYGRGVSADPSGLHHRLVRRARSAAGARPFRSRRLRRLSPGDAGASRSRGAHARRLPARRPAHHDRRADGGGEESVRPDDDDLDGRSDRHPPQSDRGQSARRKARRRMVPHPLPADRAVPLSRRGARGLSRLSTVVGLHGDEPRPPRQRARRHVQPSGQGRRRLRGKTPRVL